MKKTILFNFYIPIEYLNKLRVVSKKNFVSISSLINDSIRDWLLKNEKIADKSQK